MHQDIKTFSQALDIKTDHRLAVELELATQGHIEYRMRLNGHLILDNNTHLTLDLLNPIVLRCKVSHVADQSALQIKKLSINNMEVLPKYQHLACPATTWIDQEGVWEFMINQPFYPWYHAISGQGWVA